MSCEGPSSGVPRASCIGALKKRFFTVTPQGRVSGSARTAVEATIGHPFIEVSKYLDLLTYGTLSHLDPRTGGAARTSQQRPPGLHHDTADSRTEGASGP